jgi:hypothetical protein
MEVADGDIALLGHLPGTAECMVCVTPTSMTNEQGLALQKLLEAQFRPPKPVLLLTNNTYLCKLKPVTDFEAQRMMGRGPDAKPEIIQIQTQEEESEAGPEGGRLREQDCGDASEDLRPVDAGAGDGAGGEGQTSEGLEPTSKKLPSPTF